MSRWRVMKNHFADAWAVYHEPSKSAGMVPWYRVPQWFDTWAEAMAYADQSARTVEVTLPRVAPHPDYGYLVDPDDPWVYSWGGRWHLAPIGDWDGHAALLCNDVGEYKIYASELKPLALALLAHAERIGE